MAHSADKNQAVPSKTNIATPTTSDASTNSAPQDNNFHSNDSTDVNLKNEDSEYYLPDNVTFEVENLVFRVPQYHFLTSTDYFRSLLAKPLKGVAKGPIKLENVSSEDFRALLRLLYPRDIALSRKFSENELISILKLSTQWNMLGVRQIAFDQLSTGNLSAVTKVLLGRLCGVQGWLRDGYVELTHRKESLSVVEEAQLGEETTFMLYHSRRLALLSTINGDGATLQNQIEAPDSQWKDAVQKEFQDRIKAFRLLDPVERTILARNHGIAQWALAAFVELLERPEQLSDDDGVKLGISTSLRMCRARESFRTGSKQSVGPALKLVEQELQKELAGLSSPDLIKRYSVASSSGVAQWLHSSLVEIARNGTISKEIVELAGRKTVIGLCRVREKVLAEKYGIAGKEICTSIVDQEFQVELSAGYRSPTIKNTPVTPDSAPSNNDKPAKKGNRPGNRDRTK